MILFCNTLITETKPSIGKGFVSRENLKSFSNFDIFKYSLASLAVAYPWSKVILKISLDDIYKSRQQELEDFIKTEFKDFNLILEWQRNEYQNDWKQDYELLDDNLVWFYCNHDHIFFDSTNQYLKELVNQFNNDSSTTIYFSHFPEIIRTAKQGCYHHPLDISYVHPSYQIHDNYISVELDNFEGIQIITKDLYYKWWFEGEFNHIKLPRPDFFGIGLAEIKPVPTHKLILPLKEICRHFDGYQHVYPPIINNQCPAIDIPPGFFEGDIKIRYGYNDYKEGWVNINPKNPNYYAYNKSGTDYKFTLEDLPLVWQNRISIIDLHHSIDEEEMLQYRLKSILEMIHTSEMFIVDKEVENKILNNYLKPFNYNLDA
jgi:hypothetical protein